MDKNNEKENSDEWLSDLPIRSQDESYAADEMVGCGKCNRQNPPNRLDCMYCGVKLEISETQKQNLRPKLRNTESWKNALNLILVSKKSGWDDETLSEVAKMTPFDYAELRGLIDLEKPMPIARSEQDEEIEIVNERLKEYGAETLLLKDEALDLETPNHRLKSVEFGEKSVALRLFYKDETREFSTEEIILIVTGAVFLRRVESTEKHKRKKENKLVDMTETSADELLVDLYAKDEPIGFRISTNGFDFSCLGEQKAMLANENLKTLVQKFREFSPQASFDGDYAAMRAYLGSVWEVEEHTDSKSLKRKGFGGYSREKVATTKNIQQFLRYSRLLRYLNENQE